METAIKLLFLKLAENWWRSLGSRGRALVLHLGVEVAVGGLIAFVLYKLAVNGFFSKLDRHLMRLMALGPATFYKVKRTCSAIPHKDAWESFHTGPMALLLVPFALLIMAVVTAWPYNFYVLLRIVVCATFAFFAWRLHGAGKVKLALAMTALMILFNPFAPFHLSRDSWRLWNIVAALVMFPSIFLIVKKKEKELAAQIEHLVVPTVRQAKNPAYLYCTCCSRRVGGKAIACSNCGTILVPEID